MLAEFSINPLDKPHMSKDVARVIKILEESGLKYYLGPMSTSVEGDWQDVMAVIKECHREIAASHQRVMTAIVIDDRKDRPHSLKEAVAVVEKQLGNPVKRAAAQIKDSVNGDLNEDLDPLEEAERRELEAPV